VAAKDAHLIAHAQKGRWKCTISTVLKRLKNVFAQHVADGNANKK